MEYNKYDRNSIYEYAKKLIGKSFNDVIKDYNNLVNIKEDEPEYNLENLKLNKLNKGNLGQIIEEFYFGLKINSDSRPDFEEASMELKVTPYKINKNGTISAKERLKISSINFNKIVEEDFYDSVLWQKIQFMLLIYYLYREGIKDKKDFTIDYVYQYSPIEEDLKIIIEDYNKIKNKVEHGQAHELSEGDTMYLGACTSSSNSKVRTTQPNSAELAKPRAFSFKNSYMTYLLREFITKEHEDYDSILKDRDISQPFEDYILDLLNNNIGKSDEELSYEFFDENIKSKHKLSRIVNSILGVKTDNIEEFEKANVVVKTINLEENGGLRESMSFPAFDFIDLINQNWEESDLRNFFLEKRFLFVIFQKEGNKSILRNSLFWNMPESLLDSTVKEEWELTIDRIKNIQLTKKDSENSFRIKNNLPSAKETNVIHVRPHANRRYYKINDLNLEVGNPSDGNLLPNGDYMTKQCFWLNNSFILEEIISK